MIEYKFIIPGDPLGYYAQSGRSIWKMSPEQRKRSEKYRDFQRCVREIARFHGIPLPLQASKSCPLIIKTVSYFASGKHCDPGNVQKGVVDALFYGGNGDKYTGGSFPWPLYSKDNPRVEVTITSQAIQ